MPVLIAALAASVGVMVGSMGPWVEALVFSAGGLDAGAWGKTALILGLVCGIALVVVLFWARTPFNPRWAVPIAWAVAVTGVACLAYAVPFLIRILTLPKADVFGVHLGAQAGWGLWLLALSSAVLCGTAAVVASQIARYVAWLPDRAGRPQSSWTYRWRWVAIIASAIVVITSIIYFALNWDSDDSGGSGTHSTDLPSLPSFSIPSFSFPTDFPTWSTTPGS
jgi:hypothetical protein